jgi:pyruvate formate lyase activating enzyme
MGRYKWKQLGMEYQLENAEPPSIAIVERTVGLFREAGLKAY